jgi:hypothetical protein
MKKFLAVLVLGVVAVVIGSQWFTSGSSSGSPPTKSDATASKSDALPPSAVLKIDPRASSGTSASAVPVKRGQLPPKVSALMSDYLSRKDYPALMTKATQMPNDGEALYIRAQLLENCAKIIDEAPGKPKKTRDERRAEFIASLPQNHPDTPMRISAYDLANPDRCGTLASLETSKKEIADLFASSKTLKDPVALAKDMNCEILATNEPSKNGGAPGVEINDDRAQRVRDAIASRSPDAVRAGVGMLANSYRNGAFRIGSEGAFVDQAAMSHVATLLACQYGGDCERAVQAGCARLGRCATNNYEDYLAYYELSPSSAQLVESYRAQLTQMIDSGDFSALQLIKGDQPMDSVRVGSYFTCSQ